MHFLIPSSVFRLLVLEDAHSKAQNPKSHVESKNNEKIRKNSSKRALLKMMHEKILRRVGGRFERRAERFSVRVCTRRPRLRQAICPRQAPARVLDAGHAI